MSAHMFLKICMGGPDAYFGPSAHKESKLLQKYVEHTNDYIWVENMVTNFIWQPYINSPVPWLKKTTRGCVTWLMH